MIIYLGLMMMMLVSSLNDRSEFVLTIEDPTPVPDQEYKDADIELDEILDPDVVDLRQFHPLGGVYHIDLLEMPPQPKSVKGWTLTQVGAIFGILFSHLFQN